MAPATRRPSASTSGAATTTRRSSPTRRRGTLRGESTPFYLYDRGGQQRIREAVPGARLIALLRDPVDRAHSNWTHLWSAGLEPEGDFLRACDLEERAGGARAGRRSGATWSSAATASSCERLYEVVPREQVLRAALPRPAEQPAETLDLIFDFLGVETGRGRARSRPRTSRPTSPTAPGNRVIGAALRAGSRVGQGRLRTGLDAGRELAVPAPAARAETCGGR